MIRLRHVLRSTASPLCLDFGDIKSKFRGNVCNDMFLSFENIQNFFHHAVSRCLQKFAETNWYKFDPIVHLGLILTSTVTLTFSSYKARVKE